MGKAPLFGLALTALAGWVDAIGYLRLGGFYPSFMSGNTTQLGIALCYFKWSEAVVPALLVGLFVSGTFAAAAIAKPATRWCFAACFLLQALLLGTSVLLSVTQSSVILASAPLPFAMGLQNVTARRLSDSGVGITFVTGTLVRLGEALAAKAARAGGSWQVPMLTWLAILGGAVAGAVTYVALGAMALGVPALCCVLATFLFARRAFAGSSGGEF
jgi:uncharacterized membrane protein YoaK (UPF0700 family)